MRRIIMPDYMVNYHALSRFCDEILRHAMEYYKNNPPERGNRTTTEWVEYWIDEYLKPAIDFSLEVLKLDGDEEMEREK
jgi:hypothetical protein